MQALLAVGQHCFHRPASGRAARVADSVIAPCAGPGAPPCRRYPPCSPDDGADGAGAETTTRKRRLDRVSGWVVAGQPSRFSRQSWATPIRLGGHIEVPRRAFRLQPWAKPSTSKRCRRPDSIAGHSNAKNAAALRCDPDAIESQAALGELRPAIAGPSRPAPAPTTHRVCDPNVDFA